MSYLPTPVEAQHAAETARQLVTARLALSPDEFVDLLEVVLMDAARDPRFLGCLVASFAFLGAVLAGAGVDPNLCGEERRDAALATLQRVALHANETGWTF